MPSIELSKLQAVSPSRALSDTDRMTAKSAEKPFSIAGGGSPAAPSGVALEVGGGVDAASPPVDTDRVSQIKEALRDGSYPLVPAEIADAMIAAQVSFGIDQ